MFTNSTAKRVDQFFSETNVTFSMETMIETLLKKKKITRGHNHIRQIVWIAAKIWHCQFDETVVVFGCKEA